MRNIQQRLFAANKNQIVKSYVINMCTLILSVLPAAWISFTAGFCLIGTQLNLAKRIKKQLQNGKIDKYGKQPFSMFLQVYAEKLSEISCYGVTIGLPS